MSYTITITIEDYNVAKQMWRLMEFGNPQEVSAEFTVAGVTVARYGRRLALLPTEIDQEFIKDWESQAEADRIEASRHDPQNIRW